MSQTAVLTAMGHNSNASQDALLLTEDICHQALSEKGHYCGSSILCVVMPTMCTQAGICL